MSKTLVRAPTSYPVIKLKSAEDAEREDAAKDLTPVLEASVERQALEQIAAMDENGPTASECQRIARKALGRK